MPRYFETSSIFNFTWEQVVQGFWRRYPNPNSKHVLSEDTVVREVKDGKLLSKRLISKTNHTPKWAERFITTKKVFIVEESIVDPKNKTLVTYTRNLGYVKVMSVVEKVIYTESKENPGKTIAIRSAWIDSQIKGFSRAICAFGYERFKKNCNKMIIGFNDVLNNLYPPQNQNTNTSAMFHVESQSPTRNKFMDAAKNVKSKAVPIYASFNPNKS